MTNQTKLRSKTLGQYYTPTYIVDYIIEYTIGHLVKTDYDKISSLKVLDPACGMGIFMLRALNFLSSHQKSKLTPERLRRGILANQLYGIDLDPIQIKETLNILKCPEFDVNFKSFDALIPPPSYPFQFDTSPLEFLRSKLKKDYIDGKLSEIDKKEQQKIYQIEQRIIEILKAKLTDEYDVPSVIQPMIWEMVFPETKGRFDIIIGNPPWGADLFSSELLGSYTVATQQFDSWSLFIERCLDALTDGGRLGFVLPNTLLLNENYVEVRKFILESCKIIKIVNLGGNIFPEITQPSMIIIVEKNKPPPDHKLEVICHLSPTSISELKSNQSKLSSLHALVCPQDRFLHNPDLQFEIFSIGYEELKEAIQKDLYDKKVHVKPLGDLVTN
ncbi:MAG: class I SAM-dependent DNA methyltransferase, partial [Promethearchaeota archaeon]